MTDDIVERLRAMAQGEARSGIGRQRWMLFREAADEIEQLRELYEQTRVELASALRQCRENGGEIERLRAVIDSFEKQWAKL